MEKYSILQGNCLDILPKLPSQSVDLILCDLPYGTTGLKWDKAIPMDKLWVEYKRIIKPYRVVVLFSQQPFTTFLISSNIGWYKYNWIWQKPSGSNILNSHHQPLKVTEDICVFGNGAASPSKKGSLIYNPQFTEGKPYTCTSGQQREDENGKPNTAIANHSSRNIGGFTVVNDGRRYPTNLLQFNRDKHKLHPTQKPIALLEYLIKTYSNENDLVLDNCMGVGSCGVACLNTNRRFLGIELDNKYFNIAKERLENVKV